MLALANNPPIGLLYGAYARWACWSDLETQAVFGRAG